MFARAAVSAPLRRGMAYVADLKPSTMSDLPVPQGSWKEAHALKQRKYNLQLVGGILFAGGTIAFAKQSGLIFFGFGPKIGK